MATSVDRFLTRNTITPISPLPIVHTTKSYNIGAILNQRELKLAHCPFFGEDLLYFFYARPSYKLRDDGDEASFWELPTCFILEFRSLSSIRRVFPFDSGAFKDHRVPAYITCMDLEEFKINPAETSITRFLGAFFDNSRDYLGLRGVKDEKSFLSRFSVDTLEPEILAVRRLAADTDSHDIDDRRLNIEIASDATIQIQRDNLLAVIAPDLYFSNTPLLDVVTNVWKATPLEYPIYPLDIKSYNSKIYQLCFDFYAARGLI